MTALALLAPQSFLSAMSHVNLQFSFPEGGATQCLCPHHLMFLTGLVAGEAVSPGAWVSGQDLTVVNLSCAESPHPDSHLHGGDF